MYKLENKLLFLLRKTCKPQIRKLTQQHNYEESDFKYHKKKQGKHVSFGNITYQKQSTFLSCSKTDSSPIRRPCNLI